MLELRGAIRAFRRSGNFAIADELETRFGNYQESVGGGGVFTTEQRRALESSGYIVHLLIGHTIAELRSAGNIFWSKWHQGHEIEQVASMSTEVAINPGVLFLPRSNNKTLDEQLALVERHAEEISRRIPGLTAVLGNVADYAELAFDHLSTGVRLFGSKYHYDYTRTTLVGELHTARVGAFRGDGLEVDICFQNEIGDNILASPLIVPAAAVGR